MVSKSIIRIAAAACALFLWEGCARLDVPEPDGNNVIGFNAGTQLLKDDAPTKAGTFKGGDFVIDDEIAVYGRYYPNSGHSDYFNGTVVRKKSATEWEYSPLMVWSWQSEADYYDFLGVYPTRKGTSRMDIPGNLAISTHYSISNSNYDLMYALYRRHGSDNNRIAAVPLVFRHTLSAVGIVFTNDSNIMDITINSYEFKHMVVSADAKATMDEIGNPEITWINTTRNGNPVRHVDPNSNDALLKGKSKEGSHSYTGAYDFFIPTALDATSNGDPDAQDAQDHMPCLVITYTPTGHQTKTASILLKDIQRDPFNGDTTPVDVWEPGVRYTYHISIRMDGAVIITVVTTKWEEISAETPGVMIDDD